jgi:hypothetical protein
MGKMNWVNEWIDEILVVGAKSYSYTNNEGKIAKSNERYNS